MEDSKSKKKQKLTQPLTLELGALIDALQVLCVGKERATPTQLIKTAKARHLVGVTIFRCSTWPPPPRESFSYKLNFLYVQINTV